MPKMHQNTFGGWAQPGPALRSRCTWARGKGSSPGRVEGSSRAMLATARHSCYLFMSVSYCELSTSRKQRSYTNLQKPVKCYGHGLNF